MTDLEGLMNNKKFGEITTLLKSYDNMTYYAQQQATAVKGQMDKFLIVSTLINMRTVIVIGTPVNHILIKILMV